MMDERRPPTVHVLPSPERVAERAAELFVVAAERANEARGRFSVALSGGSTPKRLFEMLASNDWAPRVEWGRVDVFWSDERCVPPDSPESNYGLAWQQLLSRVPIDPSRVHRIHGEREPALAAAEYERVLKRCVHETEGPEPALDLVFLGLGADWHTASIFPGSSAWEAELAGPPDRWVTETYLADRRTWRITLTSRPINRARTVVFLVTGASKGPALRRVLGDDRADLLPAQVIRPTGGQLVWLVDEDAAGHS